MGQRLLVGQLSCGRGTENREALAALLTFGGRLWVIFRKSLRQCTRAIRQSVDRHEEIGDLGLSRFRSLLSDSNRGQPLLSAVKLLDCISPKSLNSRETVRRLCGIPMIGAEDLELRRPHRTKQFLGVAVSARVNQA